MPKAKKAASRPEGKSQHKKPTSARLLKNRPPDTDTPSQADLPGMEDRELAELERAALSYAGVRDERMALNKREVDLKGSLLSLMHTFGKESYQRDGITIKVVHEKETVKVKIKKEEE